MANKKTKRKIEEAKAKKNDTILAIAYLLIIFGILIALVLTVTSRPTKTLYITANHFPIIVPDAQLGDTENATVYIFNGTLQLNGTECISSAEIYTYQFNYTTQKLSSTPQITIITNPKEIADMYYNSLIGNSLLTATNMVINIPDGYTLLCPDIINATR